MNKICTSIEQSKKLTELGIDAKTADMHYVLIDSDKEIYDIGFGNYIGILPYYPAWSLSTLMNLLPSEFTEKGKYSETKYEIKIRKYLLTNDVDLYQIAYGSYKFYEDGSYSWKDMINTGEKEDLIDAVFQMVCLLLEYKKL